MKKILVLAANPRTDLRLDREIRDLQAVIERSQNGKQFEVIPGLAVRVGDLQELLLKNQPQIVHFCGHGVGEQGLVFEGDNGGEQFVPIDALSDLFRLFSKQIECVILNACYSNEQAKTIVEHINYAIGMNQTIRDDAAIAFAKGFYRALGYDRSIEEAYEFGCNEIKLKIRGDSMRLDGSRKFEVLDELKNVEIPEHLKPILKKRAIPTLNVNPNSNQDVDKVYIERHPHEKNCYQKLCKDGALIRIKAPEKMGKTLFVSQIFESLSSQGYRTARLSLQEIDRKDLVELETLLFCFCLEISREVNLPSQVKDYWDEKGGNKGKCTSYFQDYLLPAKKTPLVLAIDDVDWLFQYPSICAEFCSMLRNWHERSKTNQIWKQLRLIIVLSTEEEIKLPENQSPFNVGTEIGLTEFTLGQIQAFAQYYGLEKNAIQLSQWINLVGGHPYLLSLVFSHLSMYPEVNITELLVVASTAQGIYSSYLRKFLEMLKQNPELGKAFKSVVTSTEAVTLEISTGYKLQSMGLIKWQRNQALPSCRLYREFFSTHL